MTGARGRRTGRDSDERALVGAVAAGFGRLPAPDPPVTGSLSRYTLVLPGRCSLPGRCWVPDRTVTR